MKILTQILLVVFFLIYCQMSTAQLSKLSVELGAGLLNGGSLNAYPIRIGCFECIGEIVERRPQTGLAANIGVYVQFKPKQSIGFGALINEIRFNQSVKTVSFPIGLVSFKSTAYSLTYRSLHLSHELQILNSKSIKVVLANGILYEKLLTAKESNSVTDSFRKKNFSYFSKLEFQTEVNRLNKIVLSPMAIAAINDYHSFIKYRPFRYGLFLSWRTYLSKAKKQLS